MATVKVGSARIDENGKATGGRAGDQTGNECSTQAWYKHKKGWRVIRAINPEHRKKLASSMKAACANNHIGYDQNQRNTLYTYAEKVGFDVSKVTTNCETDCSALVRVCVAYACGITDLPSGFRTTNMCEYLLKTGAFKEMSGTKYTDKSEYLAAGDILCTKTQGHTVIVLNDGAKVEKDDTVPSSGVITVEPELSMGDVGNSVVSLQKALIAWDSDCLPVYGIDGDFGFETSNAVKAFQTAKGIEANGIVDAKTWDALDRVVYGIGITVIGNTVNLRSGAGTEYDIRGIAHRGDEMTYTQTANVNGTTWFCTAFGWISGKYARWCNHG